MEVQTKNNALKEITYDNIRKNMYFISRDGKIFSKYLNDFMKPRPDKDGYLEIGIRTEENKQRYFKVHQLVGLTYIGMPPKNLKDPTIDHIDGNILNNDYTNLRWLERRKNSSIRKNVGTGEDNHEAKLTAKDVEEICELIANKKYTLENIGRMYGVTKGSISGIKRKKHWINIASKYEFS